MYTSDTLAEFTGTIDEYIKFVGPRVRNDVQTLTKKNKKELLHICQMCGNESELEAAHKKGVERKTIIDNVLSRYYIDPDKKTIKVDLEQVQKEIIKAHMPIDEYFLFLCPRCHKKYDKES